MWQAVQVSCDEVANIWLSIKPSANYNVPPFPKLHAGAHSRSGPIPQTNSLSDFDFELIAVFKLISFL